MSILIFSLCLNFVSGTRCPVLVLMLTLDGGEFERVSPFTNANLRSCCHIWWKVHLDDDFLKILRLENIYLPVQQSINVDAKLIFYVSLVFGV